MKQLLHIGTVEPVALANKQVKDVPAKIDTGAYSSAVWASDIIKKAAACRLYCSAKNLLITPVSC